MREAHGAKIERIRRGSGRRDVGGATPLDRLVEAFGDIVVLRDKRGRILQANAAFAEATGCTEPGGRSFLDFCAVSPEGDGQVQTLTLRTCDGTRVYDWRELAGRDPETGAAVIHAIGREIAGRDPAEHELIAARERAEEANATKSRFLAMVSHELRTPLNGILGMARLLGKTRLTREQESYVGAVRHSGHALLALVEDLLDFSGMEAGKFMLRPEPGNLQELVESMVELSAARADEKGIEIAAHVAPDVPETIVADHRRLRQVLFNLVGNAVKFTDRGGVLVEVLARGDLLEFRVEDSGPGIAEADRQRIFHEFEQIDSGPTRRDGAGLGLAISARLAAAMGGTLTLESETGKGSTFILRVPFEMTASTEPAAVGQSRLEESKVLLVAPSGPTNEALLRLIRDRGGCAEAIKEAAGVADALAHLGGG
ncbi:MAG TPA: ATP-binding protein, partial [Pararhizobium sp.]|nr:ATP-binding protein [Pararhizobium sp.]